MRDIRICAILISVYLLLFGSVVAHLIFDLDVQFVWIFCWQVERLTMLVLTLTFLLLAYLIQFFLTRTHKQVHGLLLMHSLSFILIMAGMALLIIVLNSTLLSDRLVVFDMALLLIVSAWSCECYCQLRLSERKR